MFQCSVVHIPNSGTCAAAMSGILKGRFEEISSLLPCSSVQESDDEIFSCDITESVYIVNSSSPNHFTGEYHRLYFK